MKDFERWLGKKIDKFLKSITAITEYQEKHLRGYQNKSIHSMFGILGAPDSQIKNMPCWLCNQNHKIYECTQLMMLPFDDHLKLAKTKTKTNHPPSDYSFHGLHSQQNFHDTTDNHNTETQKPKKESEATNVIKRKACVIFFVITVVVPL